MSNIIKTDYHFNPGGFCGLRIGQPVNIFVFLFTVLISILSVDVAAADNTFVIFDGGDVQSGRGFALPRGISMVEISHQRPHTNKTHLDYKLKFESGWSGCGWNWHSWEGEGTDIKEYKNFVFYISLSLCNVSDITMQLTSRNKNGGEDGMGPKVSILPAITKRGEYIMISIPLERLCGGTLDETAVWGFNLGVFSGKASDVGDCRIYIDQIELTR